MRGCVWRHRPEFAIVGLDFHRSKWMASIGSKHSSGDNGSSADGQAKTRGDYRGHLGCAIDAIGADFGGALRLSDGGEPGRYDAAHHEDFQQLQSTLDQQCLSGRLPRPEQRRAAAGAWHLHAQGLRQSRDDQEGDRGWRPGSPAEQHERHLQRVPGFSAHHRQQGVRGNARAVATGLGIHPARRQRHPGGDIGDLCRVRWRRAQDRGEPARRRTGFQPVLGPRCNRARHALRPVSRRALADEHQVHRVQGQLHRCRNLADGHLFPQRLRQRRHAADPPDRRQQDPDPEPAGRRRGDLRQHGTSQCCGRPCRVRRSRQ